MEFLAKPARDSAAEFAPIDEVNRHQLWKLFHSDITISACRNLLAARLLGLGIMYSRAEPALPSQIFFRHVQKYFVPFCRDFLDTLYVQGIVPYIIVPGSRKTGGLPYPIVVPYSRYVLCRRSSTYFRTEYALQPTSQTASEDSESAFKKVLFYVETDVDAATLRPVSPMAAIFRLHSFGDMIERNTSFAEAIRCHPPIVTRAKTDHVFDERNIAQGNIDGLRAKTNSDRMTMRNKINQLQHAQTEKLAKLLNVGRIDTSSAAWQDKVDPVTGLPVFDAGAPDVYVPDFVSLPMDHDVANYNLPQSRTDLVQIQSHIVSQICIAMGVPQGHLQGTAPTSKAASMSASVLWHTLNRLRGCLSMVLYDIYRLCFSTDKATGEVTVCFPSLQEADTMRTLHIDGVLTFDAYKRFLANMYQMQQKDIVEATDEQDRQQTIAGYKRTRLHEEQDDHTQGHRVV